MLLNGFYFLGLAFVIGCYLLRTPKTEAVVISDKALRYIAWILGWFLLFKLLSLSSEMFGGNRIFAINVRDSLVHSQISNTLAYFGNSHNPVTVAVYIWYLLQIASVIISWLLRGKVANLLKAIHHQA